VSRQFEARYPGRCPAGDDILVGDILVYDGDDVVHLTCRNSIEDDRKRPVCTVCFLVKPCPCDDDGQAA